MRMEHELKTWPCYFEHVTSGNKTFEIRKNDRGFQSGDTVVLREWDPAKFICASEPVGGYTKQKAKFKIGYVYPLENHTVVFSLLPWEPK